MKKLLTVLLAGLLVCGILAFAASEEKPEVQVLSGKTADRIRNAQYVSWAGGNLVLADGELVRTEDDSIVLSGVRGFWPWGDYILTEVENEGVYVFDPDGRKEIVPGVDSVCRIGVPDGIAILENADGQISVLSRKYETIFRTGIDTTEYEIIRNPENGDAYIIFNYLYNGKEERTAVYRENGDLAWEAPYRLVINAYCWYETNGHLTGYDENGKAVVIDAFTGEVTASFPPEWSWRIFMSEYEIYEDNTALLQDYSTGETAVVSLDGEILFISKDINDRCDPTPGYYLDVNDDTYFWSGITFQFTRVIHDSDDEEIREEPVQPEDLPDSIYINPVLLDPETKERFLFKEGPDDETFEKWHAAAIYPSCIPFGIGHSCYELASRQGWAAVVDEDGMTIRLVDMNWEPIVPRTYDEFYSTGGGYIGRNNRETDFFDENLNLVMSTRTDGQ